MQNLIQDIDNKSVASEYSYREPAENFDSDNLFFDSNEVDMSWIVDPYDPPWVGVVVPFHHASNWDDVYPSETSTKFTIDEVK